MSTVESRFGRLPKLQEERHHELDQQARQAQTYSTKLEETAEEAIRIMKEEMERTQHLEMEAIRSHPQLVAWKARVAQVEARCREWQANHDRECREREGELQHLRALQGERQQQLSALEAQRADADNQWNHLSGDRWRLEQEVETSKRAEEDARRRLQDAASRLKPQEEELESLRHRLTALQEQRQRMGPEAEMARHELLCLQSQRDQLAGERSTLTTELVNLEASFQKERDALMLARAGAQQAADALAEHRGIYDQLVRGAGDHEATIRKAHEAINQADVFRGEAERLRQQEQVKYTRLGGECEGLSGKRVALQRQIEELIKERDRVDSALFERRQQQQDCQVEMHALDMDVKRAESLASDARSLLSVSETAMAEQIRKRRDEEAVMQGFLEQRNTHEAEARRIESICHDADARVSLLRARLDDLARQEATCEEAMTRCREVIVQGERDRDNVAGDIASLMAYIDRLKREIEPLRSDITDAERVIGQCADQALRARRELEVINQKLSTLKSSELMNQIDGHRSRLEELENRLGDIEGRLANLAADVNPYQVELETLRGQETEIQAAAKADILSNPPDTFRQQMAREAEAVMRAEMASGLVARQKQIEMQTKELADLEPSANPRITLDEEAAERLANEHFLGSPNLDYRRVASAIVELSEQRHISAH